ncbi:VPA1269 family protein [Rhizobium sp. PP-CC-3G-465]|uniref:VPA1269 family protein n=1 Tax=Rhizobium sp. PP-CC-3G-465 TaxID=2135648 RepID=UPI0010EC188B|nr:putative integrase [Rhizobium sp. PP-CC-3G-465]
MLIFEVDNQEILLNVSSEHIHPDSGKKLPSGVREASRVLGAHPNNVRLNSRVIEAMDELIDSGVCFSPLLLLDRETRLHPAIGQYFVNTNSFAAALYEELDGKGTFSFLERMEAQPRRTAESHIMRLLSPFAMSAIGNETVTGVPPAFIHAVVDCYRTPDGSEWREEIFAKSELMRQCARNIVIGLGQVYDDPTLTAKVVVGPRTGRGSRQWTRLAGSDEPLVRDVIRLKDIFMEESRMAPKSAKQGVMDIVNWLGDTYPGLTLLQIFQGRRTGTTLSNYLEAKAGARKPGHVPQVVAAKRLLDMFQQQLEQEHPDVVLTPLIAARELDRLKNASGMPQRKPDSARSRPLPQKLYALAIAILDEGEAGVLGEYFRVKIRIGGKVRSVYCPVIPTLLRSAFDLPLRMAQWRRLDSGEGDVYRYDPSSKSWVVNDGPLAGYWARMARKRPDDVSTRGYAYRYIEEAGEITGFWINTNKTGKPYAIPWQHDPLHLRLAELVEWQKKWNPIEEAITPKQYLDDEKNTPRITMEELPDILPLFRLFPSNVSPFPGRIPSTSDMDHAWQFLMAQLETRWNLENPDEPISIVSYQKTTGQRQKSIYGLHGLRVLGLTTLYRAGIPLELLSKMVAGHATLVMTLYYLKFDPLTVAAMLDGAMVEAKAQAQRDLINAWKTFDLEQARAQSVALTPDAIEAAVSSPSKVEYCNVDIGFCPWDCTRCWDGGPVLRKDKGSGGKAKDLRAAVEPRNCVMCRHFVTGPEWIDALQLYGSKLCEKRRYLAVKINLVNEKVEQLKTQRRADAISQQLYRQSYDALQSEIVPLMEALEPLENAIFNTETLLAACVRLLDADTESKGGNYVAASRQSVVEYLETTEFDSASMLTAASRVYPILGDDRVESYRNEHLNRIMFNSGMIPPDLIVNVTLEQRRKSHDLLADFLMKRATLTERNQLIEGTVTLETLGHRDKVLSIVSEAIGRQALMPNLSGVALIEGHG